MAVNDMGFNQLATVLNSIVSQATGQTQITPADESQFISVAQVGLNAGYDPLMTAVSQVLSKTIFSVRPYQAKFKGLQADAIRYGNHVRKLTTIDKPWEEDDRIKLVDGSAIDMYVVNKPDVLQTNFYGENVYQKSLTIFRDQLDTAFSGPDQFGQFITMIMQNASDMIEQAREETARNTVANLIAGVYYQENNSIYDTVGRCINLLEVYETETGVSLTSTTVRDPQNFAPFARWLFGYLKTISDKMTERSKFFHQSYNDGVNEHTILRHTPLDKQKCYLFSPLLNDISANVLSTTFYTRYLQLMDHESVQYWQSLTAGEEMEITCKPSVTSAALAPIDMTAIAAVDINNVFGVIFDEEAAGYTQVNEWSATTPFNARGGYSNIFWHFTLRYWNDFTENAVVLLLQNSAAVEGA